MCDLCKRPQPKPDDFVPHPADLPKPPKKEEEDK